MTSGRAEKRRQPDRPWSQARSYLGAPPRKLRGAAPLAAAVPPRAVAGAGTPWPRGPSGARDARGPSVGGPQCAGWSEGSAKATPSGAGRSAFSVLCGTWAIVPGHAPRARSATEATRGCLPRLLATLGRPLPIRSGRAPHGGRGAGWVTQESQNPTWFL